MAKKGEVPKPRGRPSTYTEAIAGAICLRIASGETLRAICRDDDMPHWTTVYEWLEADEAFSLRFARARDIGADAIAQEALDIADTPMEGVRQEKSENGMKEVREDMLGHRKLQIETRLKLLAKWFPKKYGDKLAVGGASDLPPVQTESTVTLSPLEAYQRMLNG